MRAFVKLIVSFVPVAALLLPVHLARAQPTARQHPFLLVRKSMYDHLRQRAARSPWKEMKAEAMLAASKPIPGPNVDVPAYMQCRDIAGAASLAYILDPANAATYRKTILACIQRAQTFKIGGPAWERHTPPGTALVNMILALDVIHDDLSADELRHAEEVLGNAVGRINAPGWPLNTYGVRAIWALYKGDMAKFQVNLKLYRDTFAGYVTKDGVWDEGPNYAYQRLGRIRDSKFLLMDIASFTKTYDFYSDPRFRKFYEWLFGYALTPMHSAYTFGDSYPNYRPMDEGPATPPFRAYRFSAKAGGYAAYHYLPFVKKQGFHPPPLLHGYVLTGEPLGPIIKPASRIFPDGGAFFMEDDPTTTSLAGALWNCTQRGWHSHADVNAIHLCAYGENIIQNVGYVGAGSGELGYPWKYFSHTASSNNTVLIDGVNQRIGTMYGDGGDWSGVPQTDVKDPYSKRGAGISEGFTGQKLDYACGDSGKVLPNGREERSLVFVHPQDGLNGYFVLFDEVWAHPGSHVDVYLHPNSEAPKKGPGCTTVRDGEQYAWAINGNVRWNRDNRVKVNICLGQAPSKVEFPLGLLAAWGSDRWQTIGRYLHATFATGPAGRANIPTVIYPSDPAHPAAAMHRIATDAYNGVEIDAGQGPKDYAIALPIGAEGPVEVAGVSLAGRSALFRRAKDGSLSFYFARKATQLLDAKAHVGFRSDKTITIHLKHRVGQVISPGAAVTLYAPDAAAVWLDGQPAEAHPGAGCLTIRVPAGTHQLELRTRG